LRNVPPLARLSSGAVRGCGEAGSLRQAKHPVHPLHGAARGTVAVLCAIDNLNKGAAGGALQWMNRMFGLPETAGLTAPAPGWT